MMSPVSAAVAGALISGVAMYTVGARTEKVNAFATPAPVEYVQTVDGRYVAVTPAQPQGYPTAQPQGYVMAQPAGYTNALRPAETVAPAPAPVVVERPVVVQQRPAARQTQTVYRTAAPVQERVVVEREPVNQKRSWQKTAMVIGGSAASGAAVGGIIDGKKGALIGAGIGGGAATIYEAAKR